MGIFGMLRNAIIGAAERVRERFAALKQAREANQKSDAEMKAARENLERTRRSLEAFYLKHPELMQKPIFLGHDPKSPVEFKTDASPSPSKD